MPYTHTHAVSGSMEGKVGGSCRGGEIKMEVGRRGWKWKGVG